MLIQGEMAKEMKAFMIHVNSMKQDDAEKAIETYCNKLEELIDKRIKTLTITIPPFFIQVAGTPANQSNPLPIRIDNAIS